MSDSFETEDELTLEDFPTLAAVSQFARMIGQVPWFHALGQPLTADDVALAEDYLCALGFPDAQVAFIPDWEDAEAAVRSHDWNSDWWEAEEQLRAALTTEALELMDEQDLAVALTHVANQASQVVLDAAGASAARFGVHDEELIRAAAGAASQACHQAALVLAADAGDDHPFALKYRLFEAGRWPLGVMGGSFNLF